MTTYMKDDINIITEMNAPLIFGVCLKTLYLLLFLFHGILLLQDAMPIGKELANNKIDYEKPKV
jgi:hypothetical protein